MMKVSELGEFGLIELLAKMVDAPQNEQLRIGIGDDASAWYGDTPLQLATVDSLIQDVHFSLGVTTWQELGWKALAVNLSDIAAMGGQPRYALVSLALPGETEVADVTDLYRGMIELAREFNVLIVGGDTCRSPVVVITVTVFGDAGDDRLLTRSAAGVGDKIAVTGCLGGAAAGLEMLTGRLRFDSETTADLKKAFLRPQPRVGEGQLLVRQGVRAAIDISDGLVADLAQVSKASRVSARVDIDRLPVHPAVRGSFGDRATGLALSGGEDYELLFTASAGIIDAVKEAASCPVTVIGEIIAGKQGEVNLVDARGNRYQSPRSGWEHFKT